MAREREREKRDQSLIDTRSNHSSHPPFDVLFCIRSGLQLEAQLMGHTPGSRGRALFLPFFQVRGQFR